MKTRINFDCVELNQTFGYNGNVWLKVSTQTAKSLAYNRVFYFSKKDSVLIFGLNITSETSPN